MLPSRRVRVSRRDDRAGAQGHDRRGPARGRVNAGGRHVRFQPADARRDAQRRARRARFGAPAALQGRLRVSQRPARRHVGVHVAILNPDDLDVAHNPRYATSAARRQHAAEIEEMLLPHLGRHTMEELFHGLAPLRLLIGMTRKRRPSVGRSPPGTSATSSSAQTSLKLDM